MGACGSKTSAADSADDFPIKTPNNRVSTVVTGNITYHDPEMSPLGETRTVVDSDSSEENQNHSENL